MKGLFLCTTILALGLAPLSLLADSTETVYLLTTLIPANEVPPVETEASANTIITIHIRRDDEGIIVSAIADFDLDYTLPAAAMATGLHIHEGAEGVNGPVRINSGISASNTADLDLTGALSRQVEVDDLDALQSLLDNPTSFYVNLHTPTNPGGFFRGQLARAQRAVFRVELLTANEVPPVPGLLAAGAGSLEALYSRGAEGELTDATVAFDVTYDFPANVTITGLHVHPGAVGVNGPAQLKAPLTGTDPIVDEDGNGSLHYTVAVSSDEDLEVLNDILSNPSGAYMNLHTTANPGGAIRGQLEQTGDITFNFDLSPANVTPPVEIDASGLATLHFSVARDEGGEITSATILMDSSYMFPGPVTFEGFRIQRGAVGETGPVVVNSDISSINNVVDEDGAGNLHAVVNLAPDDSVALEALINALDSPEDYYVTILTSANPAGVLRGQLAGKMNAPQVLEEGIVSATFGSEVNAASPGSLISIFGRDLAQAMGGAIVTAGKLSTEIVGTQVLIGGIPAPLLYVGPNQINAQVPYEVNPGPAVLTVMTDAGVNSTQTLQISPSAPGIFAVVTNSDFSLTSESSPVAPGDALAVFATGLGTGSPAVQTAMLPPGSPLSNTVATPMVTIGGINAEVAASVFAPGLAGVQQINVIVPAGAPSGSHELKFSVDGVESNSVTIFVE